MRLVVLLQLMLAWAGYAQPLNCCLIQSDNGRFEARITPKDRTEVDFKVGFYENVDSKGGPSAPVLRGEVMSRGLFPAVSQRLMLARLSDDGLRLAVWRLVKNGRKIGLLAPTGLVHRSSSPFDMEPFPVRLIAFFEPQFPFVGYWSGGSNTLLIVDTRTGDLKEPKGNLDTQLRAEIRNQAWHWLTNMEAIESSVKSDRLKLYACADTGIDFGACLYFLWHARVEGDRKRLELLLTNQTFIVSTWANIEEGRDEVSVYSPIRQCAENVIHAWGGSFPGKQPQEWNHMLGTILLLLPPVDIPPGAKAAFSVEMFEGADVSTKPLRAVGEFYGLPSLVPLRICGIAPGFCKIRVRFGVSPHIDAQPVYVAEGNVVAGQLSRFLIKVDK
jgi:hypothetical protein